MKKKYKPPHRIDYDMCDITITDTVSSTDFTGLIPASVDKEDDAKNYEDIKTFYPPDRDSI